MPESTFIFTDTADEAYQQTVNRNVAGSKLSQRLWNIDRYNQRDIDDVIGSFVMQGRSVTAAGKNLLKLAPEIKWVTTPGGREIPTLTDSAQRLLNTQVPKYIKDLQDAAATGRALSDNSILQTEIRKYSSYIGKLTRGELPREVAERYAHLGIGGATRQFVRRLQSANEKVYESALDKWVARKASYQARLVARNETNEAHWAALKAEGADMPYVTGYKWRLGSHPKRDICDTLAGRIFTRAELDAMSAKWGGNQRPHPNCSCWLSEEIDKDYFKNYTPSPEMLRQVQEDPRFPEAKAWATGWLEKYGVGGK